MVEPSFPQTADAGYDHDYTRRLCRQWGPVLSRIFRLQVTGLENLDPSRPGILAANHNAGLWGILDVAAIYVAFHNRTEPPLGTLSAMSEKAVFQIPGLGELAARTGLKLPTVTCLADCLDSGHWVLITPGANTDQLRPIWQKNRVRFQKAVFVKGRRVLRDQLWYVDTALTRGKPIYPVAISGTHEMTPILWESPRFLRWSGLQRLRRDEHWPGYPVTLNHFINAGLLALTPLGMVPLSWVVFALLHTYVDIVYSYPLFPFQVKLHFGEPIEADRYGPEVALHERQRMQKDVHERLVTIVNGHLRRLDGTRWWVRTANALSRLVGLGHGEDRE